MQQRIAVFLADEPTIRRLHMALGNRCRLEAFPPVAGAIQEFVDRSEVFATIVDLRGIDDSFDDEDATSDDADSVITHEGSKSDNADPAIALITALRARHPYLPILGYVDLTPRQAREILLAAQAGITDIILGEYDDSEFITRRMLGFRAVNDIQTRAFAMVGHLVPEELREFFTLCLARAAEALSVGAVASSLQISKKTLAVRLRKHQLPQPYRIIGWGRVLIASRWLEDTYTPAEQVARELLFTNGSGLRSFLRRYVGCSVEALRQKGGLDYALRLFAYELQTSRVMEPSPLSDPTRLDSESEPDDTHE
jgi:AraC-like DNA-binding protein